MREDWEYKKLEDISRSVLIEKAKKRFSPNDVIRYIDISSIDNINQCLTGTTSFKMLDAPSRAQQKVEYGDILISTVRPNLRTIAIVNDDATNLVASSGFCVLRINDAALRRYVFYYVVSNKFIAYLEKLTNGANYPAVKETDVRKALISIPPKPTQLSIVSELDKLNELIRIKKEQLKDYDTLAQSIFYETFGDPVVNDKKWEMEMLGEVCVIERGGSPRPISAYITESEEGLNWIKIGDTIDGCMYIYSTKEKIKEEGLNKTRYVHEGDLILSNSMSFGHPYILKTSGCIHDGWLVIRDKKEVFNTIYLYYTLASKSMYYQFERMAVGGVVNNLNSKMVSKVHVTIPPLSLQNTFAYKIEQIERQKASVQKTISDLETLLASRMQYWFD